MAASKVFDSKSVKVLLPEQIADGIVQEAKSTSVVARLSKAEPMRFGDTKIITFNKFPRMEFVDENTDKSPTEVEFGSVSAKPHKGQVTLRFSEEVLWADEDYQLNVLQQLGDAGKVALSRGLDLGLIHRLQPLTGEPITTWDNYLGASKHKIELDTKTDADKTVRAAVGKLVNASPAWPVNGLALDTRLGWALSELVDKDGRQRYPQLGFGNDITSFLGLNVAMGDTVSGLPEAKSDTKVRGIVGDFQGGIRWGVQRELPVEIIRFGDPDGQGDLKRKNQVALRLEIVYGWYVFADRFAVIADKTPATTGTSS